MKRKCLICNKGSLEEVNNITINLNKDIFVAKGHRCDNCKEEFPLGEETKRVIETAKLKKITRKKFLNFRKEFKVSKYW